MVGCHGAALGWDSPQYGSIDGGSRVGPEELGGGVMDKDKVYNADPVSRCARSLFAQMMERIPMDEHVRNLVICRTVAISDADLAKMLENAGLCPVSGPEEVKPC